MQTALRLVRQGMGVFALVALVGGASVLRAQSVLVPAGVSFPISPITTGPGAVGGKPAIASDGTNFLIVWKDSADVSNTNVLGARISHGGAVLDTGGFPISTSTGVLQNTAVPSVAFDGTNFLVVWVATIPGTSDNEIFGVRVAPNGTLVDMQEVQITSNADPKPRPIGLAFDGTNYLVVWRTDADHIRAMRISKAGASLDGGNGFLIASQGGDFYPWVAFNGASYLVVWHGFGSNGLDVFGARVMTDGTVLDPEGFVISNRAGDQDHTAVAFDGTNYLVTFGEAASFTSDRRTLYATRVTLSGTVLDDPPLHVADLVYAAASQNVVFDGTDFLVVWMMANFPAKFRLTDVYGRRISSAGAFPEDKPIPIGTYFGLQFAPVVGYDANAYLVAWNESLSGIVQPNGRCVDGCVYGQLLEKQAAPIVPQQNAAIAQSSLMPVTQSNEPWVAVPSPTGLTIQAVFGVSESSAHATTEGGGAPVLRYDGNQWSVWFSGPFRDRQFGLWAGAPDDAWTVGWCWGIFHLVGQNLDDTGCRTGGQQGDTFSIGFGLWGVSNSKVFTVGTQGGFQQFDGVTWTQEVTGSPFDLWDLWGTSATNVYAVGAYGTVLRYNGTTWTSEPNIPTLQSLNSVWGTGPSDIFAVGDFGTILHYNGSTWTLQNSGTEQHLFGVWGFNSFDVYAVGYNGTILHYDGGIWSSEASGSTQHLTDVGIGGNTVWAVGDFGTILRKDVTFTPPAINDGGTVNAASFMPGGVAAGAITAVFGTGLSAFTATAGATPLPTTLGGATMEFDGSVAVPEFFASPLQANIQVPWEVAGQMSANLTDTVVSLTSSPQTIGLAAFAPGLFATNQAGTGQGAILIANTPNLAAPLGMFPGSRPAVRGVDFLEIYCTGLGAVTNQPATGNAAMANPLSATTTMPTVTIGGVPATVLFSGLAPGFVGLYVVTLQVPAGAPVGNAVSVVLTIGGIQSNTVTIAVE